MMTIIVFQRATATRWGRWTCSVTSTATAHVAPAWTAATATAARRTSTTCPSAAWVSQGTFIAANPPGFPGNLLDFETCPGIPDLKKIFPGF